MAGKHLMKEMRVTSMKSLEEFEDGLADSRTDSSTDMSWERDKEGLIYEDYDDYFPSNNSTPISSSLFRLSLLENQGYMSDVWERSSTESNTTASSKLHSRNARSKATESNPQNNSGIESSQHLPSDESRVQTFDPTKISELTAELLEFCIKLLWEFLTTKEPYPEEYVQNKLVEASEKMSDWETIAAIEVFYSCLEKMEVLDTVMAGFKRFLGQKIFYQITSFELLQMKVLSFLILYECHRIGLKVMTNVLLHFSALNIRRLYFYLGGQLINTRDTSLKTMLVNKKGVDYFNFLVRPNFVIAERLLKRVPKILFKNRPSVLERKSASHQLQIGVGKGEHLIQCKETEENMNIHNVGSSSCSSKKTATTSTPRSDAEYYYAVQREAAKIKAGEYRKKDLADIRAILKEPSYRGKQTTTSILRERQLLKNIVLKDANVDFESTLKALKDKQSEALRKATEIREEEKRRKKLWLHSKLTYHKAIAATKDVQGKKLEVGKSVRDEKEMLRVANVQQRLQQLAEKQRQAKQMADWEMERKRKAADEVIKKKKEIANDVKKTKEELRNQSKLEEKKKELKRLDNIRKVQALHKPTNCDANVSAKFIQESVLRQAHKAKNYMQLQIARVKEEEKFRTTQKKICDAKIQNERKLNKAKNEIEVLRETNDFKKLLEKEPVDFPESDEEEEIVNMREELRRFKEINNNKPLKR